MDRPLPFLISIPHSGEQIPACVQNRIALSKAEILEDGDAFTAQIYNLADAAHTMVKADVARAIVDLNRAVTDMPPAHPDGILKTVTCYHKPVYHQGRFPEPTLVDRLIREHYQPYHDRIRAAVKREDVMLGLDCHSMAAQAPPIETEPGRPRPLICLANAHGQSCPMSRIETLAACFREIFELEPDQVTLNDPFSGGFITRTYGNNPIFWIQIEINRSLYLQPPWYDSSTLTIDEDHLAHLRTLVTETLARFHALLSR
jgi:N-formylglutamate amidohydrolase